MWGIIATWAMIYDGVSKGSELFIDLPNEKGIVELDAGFMDGDRLTVGVVEEAVQRVVAEFSEKLKWKDNLYMKPKRIYE